MARLSFIVPCYNSETLLPPCLKSLGRQTLKEVEFIFVDDGSTDGTKAIIEDFIRSETRAKLFSQANSGLAAARLTGLKNATADLVTFVDSDDFVDTTVAEEAIDIFDCDKSTDAVLYNLAYLKNGDLSQFFYTTRFPISGMDVLRHTIPSWKISTIGVYRRQHALNAYASINFSAINSDEVANRLIFESCRRVAKMESQYYYVQRGDSISKKPSRRYITRLESSSWLREYSISKLASHITRKDADIHYVNELCELMIKFRSFKGAMNTETRLEWARGISKHRRRVLTNSMKSIITDPFGFFFDIKFMKKTLFIFAWPALNR